MKNLECTFVAVITIFDVFKCAMCELIYTVYALYSPSLDQIYVGQTDLLMRRLNQHKAGLSRYTKRASDWILIYTEECCSRSEVRKRESQLKSHQGRNYLRSLIP
jgi:putative endonuclease